jgi:hypothetical protein
LRHFAAARRFGRFRIEADIGLDFARLGLFAALLYIRSMRKRGGGKSNQRGRPVATWQISRLRGTPAAFIGLVDAPDAASAKERAIKQFAIRPEDRDHLIAVRQWRARPATIRAGSVRNIPAGPGAAAIQPRANAVERECPVLSVMIQSRASDLSCRRISLCMSTATRGRFTKAVAPQVEVGILPSERISARCASRS